MRAADLTTPEPFLIVVHPGSACGSADFNLGQSEANEARNFLSRDLAAWSGPVLVVDGNLSDELPRYPTLNSALTALVARAKGKRIFACAEETPNWPAKVGRAINALDRATPIQITGVWFSRVDGTGCVNTVYDTAKSMGFTKVDVRDSAIAEADGDDPDGDYEDGDEE